MSTAALNVVKLTRVPGHRLLWTLARPTTHQTRPSPPPAAVPVLPKVALKKPILPWTLHRAYSTVPKESEEYHNIIQNSEKASTEGEKHDFQAETRMLLDIVAKSLYSDKDIFVRELISNASDALEKFRYLRLTELAENKEAQEAALEIHIATDKQARTFTIQDTGIGMTREEMISCLGTIARSGSKEFLKENLGKGNTDSIIGQFGVGFYSAFMVADKVEVFSKSRKSDKAYKWTSDGDGSYEITEAEGVLEGTKIVLHLKTDSREFADEDKVREIIRKFSNFVGSPIYCNGKKANQLQAVWLMDPKEVTKEMHNEFYRFVSGAYDSPRFTLHFKTDVPLQLSTLLYVPESKPGMFEMSRDSESGVALYSRKVLIKPKAEILPKWLRFVKGCVDSEDIPLNLSRELLQDSALIRKIRSLITSKLIRLLQDSMKKDPASYEEFYTNYNVFLKEGILASNEQSEKEDIAKLLQFESSTLEPGQKTSISDYLGRMKEGQKDIYYLAAPSRQLAENSPYFEGVKKKDVEVLFCYQPYDELVLVQLRNFKSKAVISVEKEMRRDAETEPMATESMKELSEWLKTTLQPKVHKVKMTGRLSEHPCLISVEEMAAARHFVKTSLSQFSEDDRYKLLEPTLELNPTHSIILKLTALKDSNPSLAKKLAEQLFYNAMVSAGLVDDPRTVTAGLNSLLNELLEKH
ncbi:heat shock protein 75 kDa, mitochondrial [Galendromus occidentalis]|uniref:Heat shock protein 75 kDa, mitochondrial n=1 Tax=Galendromus occidentalis TaxID=34638 RepID=A0AAJ6QQH3_9ACAR|nr:heat shock protein 75 kDa, mitochondrial [Galendromus occidentalis]